MNARPPRNRLADAITWDPPSESQQDGSAINRVVCQIALEAILTHLGGRYGDADCPLTRLTLLTQEAGV